MEESTATTQLPQEQPQPGGEAPAAPPENQNTPTETKKPDLSYLIKREKEAFEISQKAKSRQSEVEKKLQEIEARERSFQEREAAFKRKLELAKQNPEDFLTEAGLSYSDLTDYYMNGKKPTPDLQVRSLEEKFNKFLESQESEKEKAAQAEKERLEAQKKAEYESFKTSVQDHIKKNSDKYELTAAFEQAGLVSDTIEKHYQNTGEVMTYDDAADLVEKYLEEQFDRGVKTKKLSSKYTRAQQEAMDEAQSKPETRTLSNSMTTSTQPHIGVRPSHDDNRIERALKVFQEFGNR